MSTKLEKLLNNIRTESKSARIKDALDSIKSVYTDTVEFGNLNDFVNLLNRVAPYLDADDMNSIISSLESLNISDGDKITVSYSNTKDDESILSYPVKENYINFYKPLN